METLTKESADKIMQTKGEVRGLNIKADADFVLKEKGSEGLKKLEDRMKELGHPVNYGSITAMVFYPIGLKALSLLAIDELFDFTPEQIAQMGEFQAKLPFVVRLFMGYFFSLKKIVRQVPVLWQKYYTVGDIEVTEFEEEKKFGVLAIKNLPLPEIYFKTLEGFFRGIVKMIIKKEVSCKQTKSVFKGDPHNEFLIKW